VGIERARAGVGKGLCQRVEGSRRAVPDEFVGEIGQREAKVGLERPPHQRVHPIGGNNQVKAGKLVDRVDRPLEAADHPRCPRLALQELQKFEATDGRKADAVDDDPLTTMHKRDVTPGFHMWRNQIDRARVVLAQEFQRPFREDNAEAPRGVGRILLEELDPVARVSCLPQRGEI
jgi:hypothetical protein